MNLNIFGTSSELRNFGQMENDAIALNSTLKSRVPHEIQHDPGDSQHDSRLFFHGFQDEEARFSAVTVSAPNRSRPSEPRRRYGKAPGNSPLEVGSWKPLELMWFEVWKIASFP